MKRILLVNNYDMSQSRELYVKGSSPSHHLFGTNELIESGKYEVDYALVSPKNYHNKLLKLLSLIPIWIKIYKKSLQYDYVYGAADFTVDFLGMAKKIGLFRPKLIAIFHHPPFKHRLAIEKFDGIIFLGKDAFNEMKATFPSQSNKMHFFQWGPDLKFYERIATIPNCQNEHKEIVFISNGKTKRDHEILVSTSEAIKAKTIIVSDKQNLPKNFNADNTYVEIFYQEKPDDIKMVELLNRCSVLVIPTPKGPIKYGPIGLTSLVDAIALGMPVITADNTVFAEIVEKEKIGLVYKSGDMSDLKRCMQYFLDHPEEINAMGQNAYNYGRTHNITAFAQKLEAVLKLNK